MNATEVVSGQIFIGEATTNILWANEAEKFKVYPETVFPNSSQRYTIAQALFKPASMYGDSKVTYENN